MAFKPLTVNTPIGKKAHILAEDDAALYDGIFGEDCVLKLGEQFASKTISNNVIRVMDGVVVVGGHVGRIIKGGYEDMMIDNGTADQKRNDLIVARFQSGGTGGADTYSLVVVKGTPGSTAKDPAIVQEDLYAGGKQRDYPLYRVRIENLSVVGVDKLFKVNRNFKVLAEELDKTGEKIDSVNQTLEERTGEELRLYVNKEGGAIEFTEKGTDRKWRMNLLNGVFRLYAERPGDKYCVYSFPTTEAGGKGGTVGTVEQIDAVKKVLEERTNGKVKIYSDAEGGNIRITSPLGTTWEMDAYKEYLRIYTMSQEGKYCGYTFGRDFTNGGGTIATKEELKPVKDMLITNVQTVGSAYGVTAKRRSTTHVTSVYFTGAHVGDKMAAYTQRNMGTIPAGYRPLAKVQSQVPGVNGLFLTVEPSGVVSMRNEHYAEISFSKLTVSGCVTYMNG